MFNNNLWLSLIMWFIVAFNIIGCSTNPINENCISISNNKIEHTNNILGENTENGLIVGSVSGGVVGGISGMIAGYTSWLTMNIIPIIAAGTISGGVASTSLPIGVAYIPLFVISSGVIVSIGGIIIGAGIGGISGYIYDYFFNVDSGTYMYEVVCSKEGNKLYTEISEVGVDHSIITSKFSVMQKDKQPIKNGTKVNLYYKNRQYQIKKQNQINL